MTITQSFPTNRTSVFSAPEKMQYTTRNDIGPWPIDQYMGWSENITIQGYNDNPGAPYTVAGNQKILNIQGGTNNAFPAGLDIIAQRFFTNTQISHGVDTNAIGSIRVLELDTIMNSQAAVAIGTVNEVSALYVWNRLGICSVASNLQVGDFAGIRIATPSYGSAGGVARSIGIKIDDLITADPTPVADTLAILTGLGRVEFNDTLKVRNSAGARVIQIDGAPSSVRGLELQSGGVLRVKLATDATAETGANAGSLCVLSVYDDSGVLTSNVLSTPRTASGTITLGSAAKTVTIPGFLFVGAGKSISIGGSQVVGSRSTGWTAPTGAGSKSTWDVATVTLPQLAAWCKSLSDAIFQTTGHGLIGT